MLDLPLQPSSSVPQVDIALQIKPKLRRHIEELSQSQRYFEADRTALPQQRIDRLPGPGARPRL